MDDYGFSLYDGLYDWLVVLFPYFPDAAAQTPEGNLYEGH